MIRGVLLSIAAFFVSGLAQAADKPTSTLDALGTNALVAPKPATRAGLPSAALPGPLPGQPSAPNPAAALLTESFQLLGQGKNDAALEKANALIQMDPKNPDGYGMRGSIYTEMKQWDNATKDFNMVLQLDPKNGPAVFNLAEIKFQQKLYDDARAGFLPLTKTDALGELAQYKVFLCDLFSGKEQLAQKELDAFNAVGSGPAYYFGNAAWNLYHQKTEDARSWLVSGVKIYSQNKVNLYAASLKAMGYLPLPPPTSAP